MKKGDDDGAKKKTRSFLGSARVDVQEGVLYRYLTEIYNW